MIAELALMKKNIITLLMEKKINFSVTAIIDKFFIEFDSGYWAKRKAVEKLTRDGVVIDEESLIISNKRYIK